MSPSVLTAQEPTERPLRAPATVADVMRPITTTAGENDHAAAAEYLMKHARATAVVVLGYRTERPVGILTEADIARAVAEGKDLNHVRIRSLMAAGPSAVLASTSIRDAAAVMLATGYRQLPVTGDDGRAGMVEIADICGALPGGHRHSASAPPDPCGA